MLYWRAFVALLHDVNITNDLHFQFCSYILLKPTLFNQLHVIRYISTASVLLKIRYTQKKDNIKTDLPAMLTWLDCTGLEYAPMTSFFIFYFFIYLLEVLKAEYQSGFSWRECHFLTRRMYVQTSPRWPRPSFNLVIVREYPCGPTAGRPQYMLSLGRKYSTVFHISTHQG
jgi:hypothetical protein